MSKSALVIALAVTLLVAAEAFAKGSFYMMGLGGGGSAGVCAPSAFLIQTGSKLLIQTGSVLEIQSC